MKQILSPRMMQSPMAMETITEMEFVKVEIKIEPPEYHSDSFAVHQGTLDISDNYNVDEIVLSSIKSDPDITRGSIKTEVETEAGQSQAYKIKLEKHMDTATMEITEGLIVKSEDDCDRFIDVNPDMFYNEIDNDYTENEDDPKFMPTNHKAPLDTDNHYQNKYISHLHCQSSIDGESSVACKQHYVAYNKASGKLFSCCNCKNSPCCKVPLDEIMEEHKQDPDSISSASCKSSSSFKCICCNASFKTKRAMDEHVVKKHPKFKSTLSSKLHECTFCSYKTTKKDIFNNHMFKQHPDKVHRLTCEHCNSTCSSKPELDYHIEKKHPEFIHCTYESNHFKCNYCKGTYNTKRRINEHIAKKHSEFISTSPNSTSRSELLYICEHCNVSFTRKCRRDDHVLGKHPEFISKISCKVLECTYCSFKTAIKDRFEKHILRHVLNTCTHCNESFETKMMLNTHIFQKHDLISFI
ncbi:unnamed protein product [Acanthoscelides obtectus]|uniref:C2H2-type domain-containing protein n=1 Tax=Acanthoscelides obtectus TaxID=200917 RepID=A0A9P0K6V5_ACAOB|nr:unnamed protein product [Acanthoscelides obtectus]CAK1631184.1 Zinc finger protein ZFAT [Acanthoscelides obtectus]